MLTCLWIGHTQLMHGHLLRCDPPPVCIYCDVVSLSVSHILVDFPCCSEARHLYHLHRTLPDMLGDSHCSVTCFWLSCMPLGFPYQYSGQEFSVLEF